MTERDPYIDVLKGWTIMIVVIGHAMQRAEGMGIWPWPITGVGASIIPRVLATASNSMPLFIAISGYLVFGRVRKPVARWLTSKAWLLLVPWASWTLVYYALVKDRFIPTNMPLLVYLRAQVLAPSLWYLVVLFFLCAMVAVCLKVGEWTLPVLGLLLALVPLPWLYGRIPVLSLLPWYWWWFIAGYFFARLRTQIVGSPRQALAAAAPIAAVGFFLPLGSGGGVRSLIIMGLSAAMVNALASWAILHTPAQRLFAFMGVHSLEIYVGHFLFVWIIFIRSPMNVIPAVLIAIAGSLALGHILHSSHVTNSIFLGGKTLPSHIT